MRRADRSAVCFFQNVSYHTVSGGSIPDHLGDCSHQLYRDLFHCDPEVHKKRNSFIINLPYSTIESMEDVIIRPLRDSEKEILKDFLYEAIFVPEGEEPPDRSILNREELMVYLYAFGRGKADYCLVAETDEKIVGAVWTRIMNDYGHVDDETPSLAISLYKEYRGLGIGTRMMQEMLALLKSKGYRKASLAVQKANYAVKMYEKLGFQTIHESEEEYIMVCDLLQE